MDVSPLLKSAAESLVGLGSARGIRITLAESCTGGLIGAAITSAPGSSSVFDRGFVTYSNEAKADILNVDVALIEEFGAVSRQVAMAMASGALAKSRSDAALSVTGVAGPGGGTPAKPIGLVWFGWATRKTPTCSFERRFGEMDRSEIRVRATETALSFLIERLSNF